MDVFRRYPKRCEASVGTTAGDGNLQIGGCLQDDLVSAACIKAVGNTLPNGLSTAYAFELKLTDKDVHAA